MPYRLLEKGSGRGSEADGEMDGTVWMKSSHRCGKSTFTNRSKDSVFGKKGGFFCGEIDRRWKMIYNKW